MSQFGPDTSATLYDLLVRVAEVAGCASYENPDDATDNRARPPTDPHDLDRCTRAINDAQNHMARAYHWECLQQNISIPLSSDGAGPMNVDGDPAIYALPWYCVTGNPPAAWTLYDSASGSLIATDVVTTDFARVRAKQVSLPNTTGRPTMAGINNAVRGQRRGWNLHIWPRPGYDYTLDAQMRIAPVKLINMDDRHIFGSAHDDTLTRLAMWIVRRDDATDPQQVQVLKAAADEALAQSIAVDGENVPRTLGALADPTYGNTKRGNAYSYQVFLNGTRYV